MGCRGYCLSEKLFILVNVAFAMYAGALLATAARLAWDPSTYAWLRWLCVAQYRVSAAFVLAAALVLAALVALAASALHPPPTTARALHVYVCGLVALAASEVAYVCWMGASLAAWWRSSPQAALARRGLDVLHDLKPALLAVERYRDVARALYDVIDETERAAPNNAYLVIVFAFLGAVLQVFAFVLARRLARTGAARSLPTDDELEGGSVRGEGGHDKPHHHDDHDHDEHDEKEPLPGDKGERGKANLRMYTILDKIF